MKKLLVLLVVFAVFFSVPAMAQRGESNAADKIIKVSGEVWFNTWFDQSDKYASGLKDDSGNDVESKWGLRDYSLNTSQTRLTIDVKYENFRGFVMLNANTTVDDYRGGDGSPHYREWWFEHDFGIFKWLFGHGFSPGNQDFVKTQGRGLMENWAGYIHYTGKRVDHMKVTVPTGSIGDLQIALVEPLCDDPSGLGTSATLNKGTGTVTQPSYRREYKYPKVEGLYTFDMKTDSFGLNLKALGCYQSMDYYPKAGTTGSSEKTETVVSWGYALLGEFKFGPVGVYGNIGLVKNAKEGGDNAAVFSAVYTGGKLYETEELNAFICGSFRFNPMFELRAGYGLRDAELDGAASKSKQTKSRLFTNLVINITNNLIVNPEFGILDNGELDNGSTKTKKGKTMYAGFTTKAKF